MLARVLDRPTEVVLFSFEGDTEDGVPTASRADLVSVLRALHGWRHPDDVVLAAGEQASNRVEHGGGGLRLNVDFNSALTRLYDVEAKPDGGHGQQVVDEVAHNSGWWPPVSFTTVWATFPPDTQEEP